MPGLSERQYVVHGSSLFNTTHTKLNTGPNPPKNDPNSTRGLTQPMGNSEVLVKRQGPDQTIGIAGWEHTIGLNMTRQMMANSSDGVREFQVSIEYSPNLTHANRTTNPGIDD